MNLKEAVSLHDMSIINTTIKIITELNRIKVV